MLSYQLNSRAVMNDTIAPVVCVNSASHQGCLLITMPAIRIEYLRLNVDVSRASVKTTQLSSHLHQWLLLLLWLLMPACGLIDQCLETMSVYLAKCFPRWLSLLSSAPD